MKNGILSLRDLTVMDWKGFVEQQSAVEHILREDPAGIHQGMSFASRDHYRQVVQRLARRSALDEEQVARAVIEYARKAAASAAVPARPGGRWPSDSRRSNSTWATTWSIGAAPPWKPASDTARHVVCALGRFLRRAPLASYLGAVLSVWLLAVYSVAARA